MKQSTINSIMAGVKKEIRKSKSDHDMFCRVIRYIINSSHEVYGEHGNDGHEVRQHIRQDLWAVAQRRHPELKQFVIEGEIRGNSRYFIVKPKRRNTTILSIPHCVIKAMF